MLVQLEVFKYSELAPQAKEKVRRMLEVDGAFSVYINALQRDIAEEEGENFLDIDMSYYYEDEQIDDYLLNNYPDTFYTSEGFEVSDLISKFFVNVK